jgi:hypothetical protein
MVNMSVLSLDSEGNLWGSVQSKCITGKILITWLVETLC